MNRLFADLRRALRAMLARPAFFLTSVATLALGLCALAAIFTVYNAVLLQPLPFADADRIVEVQRVQPPVSNGPVARPVFQEWRDRSSGQFDAIGAYVTTTMNLTGAGDAARLTACAVSPGFWSVFGTPLALGHAFGKDEENSNARVVVLSDAVWRNNFNGVAGIIGRDITLNGESYRVVGVTAPRFSYPLDAQIWLPTYLPSSTMGRGNSYLSVVARLRADTSVAAASEALASITNWEAKTWPDNHMGLSARLQTLQQNLTGDVHQPLTMLLLASALVLLIACANLTNLMLARGQSREREFALRRALGADRRGLIRAVLSEAVVIAACGTTLGLLAAQPAVRLLMSFAPDLLPTAGTPSVDMRVVASCVGAAAMLAAARREAVCVRCW